MEDSQQLHRIQGDGFHRTHVLVLLRTLLHSALLDSDKNVFFQGEAEDNKAEGEAVVEGMVSSEEEVVALAEQEAEHSRDHLHSNTADHSHNHHNHHILCHENWNKLAQEHTLEEEKEEGGNQQK